MTTLRSLWARLLGISLSVVLAVWVSCLGGQDSIPIGGICTSDGACDGALICSYGRCRDQCTYDRDCAGLSCVPSVDDASIRVCMLPDESCVLDSDCPDGLLCAVDGQCHEGCRTDDDCAGDRECVGGTCMERHVLADAGLDPDADTADSGVPTDDADLIDATGEDVGDEQVDDADGTTDSSDVNADADADADDGQTDSGAPPDGDVATVDVVYCGAIDVQCSGHCCMTRNTCELACDGCAHKEGFDINECDGPEDCGEGEICCVVGTAIDCVATENECSQPPCYPLDNIDCSGSDYCCPISPVSAVGVCLNLN